MSKPGMHHFSGAPKKTASLGKGANYNIICASLLNLKIGAMKWLSPSDRLWDQDLYMQGNEWEIHAVRGPSSDFVRIRKDSWTLMHQLWLRVQHPIPSKWLVALPTVLSQQQQTLFAISVQCSRRTTNHWCTIPVSVEHKIYLTLKRLIIINGAKTDYSEWKEQTRGRKGSKTSNW